MTIQTAYKSDKAREKALASYENILSEWPVSYENRLIMTSFGETNIMITGIPNAKPLLLLHGGGGNSTMWMSIIAELSMHFRVYAIDIIGEAGKSAGTRPTYTSDGHACWLKEVCDALSISNAALCGASLGGTIAHQFALRFPQYVSELILLAPPSLYKMNPGFLFRAILATIWPSTFFVKKFLYYMSSRAPQFPEPHIQTFCIQVQSYKPNMNKIPVITDGDLAKFPNKTLVIFGQDEVLYNPKIVASRIHNIAPFITVAMIPGAKHMTSIDQPDLVNEKIIQFLKMP
ncbi:MAG: alpha/beta hydrolase [Gammaproteobacteria bacterium]|nr:alpha/beta hydrolase [Gammaproteobacteria bacterium]